MFRYRPRWTVVVCLDRVKKCVVFRNVSWRGHAEHYGEPTEKSLWDSPTLLDAGLRLIGQTISIRGRRTAAYS